MSQNLQFIVVWYWPFCKCSTQHLWKYYMVFCFLCKCWKVNISGKIFLTVSLLCFRPFFGSKKVYVVFSVIQAHVDQSPVFNTVVFCQLKNKLLKNKISKFHNHVNSFSKIYHAQFQSLSLHQENKCMFLEDFIKTERIVPLIFVCH